MPSGRPVKTTRLPSGDHRALVLCMPSKVSRDVEPRSRSISQRLPVLVFRSCFSTAIVEPSGEMLAVW